MKNTTEHTTSIISINIRREAYIAPAIRPLGAWQSLTLVTTLPVNPGGYIFGRKDEEIV